MGTPFHGRQAAAMHAFYPLAAYLLVTEKKAIQSLRLRLHSGLRQSGAGLRPGFYGTVGTVPFRSWWTFGISRSGSALRDGSHLRSEM
jgi:hypothetical protein